MEREALPRLDTAPELMRSLAGYCRLERGGIWEDPVRGHRVGVLDATNRSEIAGMLGGRSAALVVSDPPYNIAVGGRRSERLLDETLVDYLAFSRRWVEATIPAMAAHSHLYVWLGADQFHGFQPLADFMILMRRYQELRSRSFISVRNQRGYGTQRNWMAVRQELLNYVKGSPPFHVVYTDIPKILRGYYKTVGGERTENLERGRSPTIRPGNIWVDIQQVFYRLEENVPGAYAQKPLKAIERIIASSSDEGDLVADFFAHSGTTLVASERLGRVCFTSDVEPVFAEIAIRRLERFRETGKTGFQTANPFPEMGTAAGLPPRSQSSS